MGAVEPLEVRAGEGEVLRAETATEETVAVASVIDGSHGTKRTPGHHVLKMPTGGEASVAPQPLGEASRNAGTTETVGRINAMTVVTADQIEE